MKYSGQVIRVNCKRCGGIMAKWERTPQELEIIYPYPFNSICGRCLTKQEVDFNMDTGGLILTYEKEIRGVFKYNSESKKFLKFTFKAEGGAIGDIFFPKDVKHIPSRITLDSEIRKEIERAMNEPEIALKNGN